MSKDSEKLEKIYGETIDLITPSGFEVTLRQQTGDDDDIMSNAAKSVDGTSMNLFVQAIIIKTNMVPTGHLSLEDVFKMKLCDKYFIIISSRMFSIDTICKFQYEWPENLMVEYEEDLTKYVWDYSKLDTFPDKGTEGYFKYRIPPHKFGKDLSREFIIPTGKKLKYDFVNGYGEKYLMGLTSEKLSKNQELLARNLQLYLNNNWVKVQNFKPFSSREMVEIRKEVLNNDPVLETFSDIENPDTHEKIQFPLLGTPDFFFPREI